MLKLMTATVSLSALLLACAHEQHQTRTNHEGSSDVRAADRERDADSKNSAELAQERSQTYQEEADDANLEQGPTAMDQGNGAIDLDLTQRIRKALMDDDSLSFQAKNTTIVARNGQVTLRGTVNDAAEKQTIYRTAENAAGAGHVTDQLQVERD